MLADQGDADQLPGKEDAMEVRLTSEESDALVEILEERDRALLNEISHTRRDALKKDLKKKETLLESILQRLEVEKAGEQDFSDLWW
jgi:hypothetical protein